MSRFASDFRYSDQEASTAGAPGAGDPVRAHLVTPWQPNTVRALEKNILVKRAGEWRIVQHQQTLVAPGVP